MVNILHLYHHAQAWVNEHPRVRLQLVIIAAVMLASLYMAARTAQVDQLNQLLFTPVMIVFAGLVGAAIFLTHPTWGLVALLPAFILVVMDVGTGSGTNIGAPVLLVILLLGLWFFDMIARQRAIHLYHSLTLVPLIAFLVVSLVALGFGQLPWFDFYKHAPIRAQLGEIGIYVISFGLFLWVGHNLPGVDALKTAIVLFFIAAVVLMSGEYSSALYRATSHLVHIAARNGSLFWTWLTAICFSQIVLNRKLPIAWRAALVLIQLSAIYIGFVKNEGWTSGWLPPFVSIAVIVWFGFPRLRKWTILAGILGAIFMWQKVYGVMMVGDNSYSLETRLAAWQIIARIVPVDPLFGLGPANYYWFTPLFSIMGYRVVFNSHNNYVDLIAQLGIVGMACFLWFAGSVLRVAFRLRAVVQDDFTRAFVHGVLGGWIASLVAGMFGDWLLPFVYNIGYAGLRASLMGWFFLGALLYLERVYLGLANAGQSSAEEP